MLAPGAPDESVQFVDVDDLAEWLLLAGTTGLAGAYDGMGLPMPRARFLAGMRDAVAPPGTTLTWVDQEFLVEHECGRGRGSGRCRSGCRSPSTAGS